MGRWAFEFKQRMLNKKPLNSQLGGRPFGPNASVAFMHIPRTSGT